MKLIDIAMATYNGADYIKEQINSIRQQTYSNWRLLISDDCSTDQTVSIIKEFMLLDERIILISEVRQGGVVKNFNNALARTSADYIALSDQDDIWPEDRLAKLVTHLDELQNVHPGIGILVFTDLTLVDDKNNLLETSFYHANKINPLDNITGNNLIWRSSVYGCTTIMNRQLLGISLPIPDYALMHDHWLAMNAQSNNGLFFYDFASIRYRQHANNVVGGNNKTFVEKLKAVRKSIRTIFAQVSKTKEMMDAKFSKNPEEYDKSKPNRFFFLKFALANVLPYIFKGGKKIYSLFVFIGFVIIR